MSVWHHLQILCCIVPYRSNPCPARISAISRHHHQASFWVLVKWSCSFAHSYLLLSTHTWRYVVFFPIWWAQFHCHFTGKYFLEVWKLPASGRYRSQHRCRGSSKLPRNVVLWPLHTMPCIVRLVMIQGVLRNWGQQQNAFLRRDRCKTRVYPSTARTFWDLQTAKWNWWWRSIQNFVHIPYCNMPTTAMFAIDFSDVCCLNDDNMSFKSLSSIESLSLSILVSLCSVCLLLPRCRLQALVASDVQPSSHLLAL